MTGERTWHDDRVPSETPTEQLAERLAGIADLHDGPSPTGGTAWFRGRREVLRIRGDREVDLRLGRQLVTAFRRAPYGTPDLLFRPSASDWVVVHLDGPGDIDWVVDRLTAIAGGASR